MLCSDYMASTLPTSNRTLLNQLRVETASTVVVQLYLYEALLQRVQKNLVHHHVTYLVFFFLFCSRVRVGWNDIGIKR